MKTVRFHDVVKRCGAPSAHLFWGPPEKDREFQSALKNVRVLTVHQELHGGKKDFGQVGFEPGPHAQVLIFPKSLRRFAAARIVAIDFDLLAKDLSSKSSTVQPVARKSAKEKPVNETKKDDVVPRSPAAKPSPRPKPSPAPRAQAAAISLPGKISAEIKKALRELKAGRTVAAYERLTALVK